MSNAAVIVYIVHQFVKAGCEPDEWIVITPYNGQKNLYMAAFCALAANNGWEINRLPDVQTAESMMGQEVDLTIFLFQQQRAGSNRNRE